MSLGISAKIVWCTTCKKDVLEVHRGDDVIRHCACQLPADQLAAIARHAEHRQECEARDKAREDAAKTVKADAENEKRLAREMHNEATQLRVEAKQCWERRGRQCDVTLSQIEHRGCPKCPKFHLKRKRKVAQ